MAAPLPDVMYGTPEGVALDRGAAEAAMRQSRSMRQPVPGIPGLEVTERFGPQRVSPQGQAFRDMRAAPPNMGPQPQVPPQAGGWTGRMNAAASAIDANSAAQKAVIGEKLAAVQRGVQGAKDFGTAAGGLVSSAMNNPLMGGASRVFGGVTALQDMADAKKNLDAGNTAGAIDRGLTAGAGALGTIGSMAGAGGVGTAYLAGHALGTGIDKGLQQFEGGRNLRDWIGSKVNNIANAFGGGVDGSRIEAADRFVRGLPAIAPGGAPGAVKPAALPQATYSNEGRNASTMRTGPAAPTSPFVGSNENGSIGTITRKGNSFTGQNIGFAGPEAQPSEGFRQDLLTLQRNAAERAAAPVGGATDMGGRTTMLDDLVAKHNAAKGVDMSGLSPYDRAQMMQQQKMADQARAVSMRGQDVQSRGQDLGAQTAMRGQDIGLQSAREGNQVSMRGQDIGASTALAGQQNSARIAAAQARMEQFNKDRQFGADQDKTHWEQRQKGEEGHNKWAESTFVGPDGKPDAARIADFNRTAMNTIGTTISMLQQKGDPASLKKAQYLSERGLGGLDAQDRAELQTLYGRREAHMRDSSKINPLASSGAVSDNLHDYRYGGNDNGLFQNRIVLGDPRAGRTISETSLQYPNSQNHFLPNSGPPTTALMPMVNERREGIR